MQYKFFSASMTREQIKAAYRELAKRWHPDLTHQDTTATMQAINAEYSAAMDAATRSEAPGKTESAYQWHAQNNDLVRQAIIDALKMFGPFHFVEIEICGAWLWIHGTARRGTSVANDAVLDLLKAAGYRFAPQKKLWYLALVPSKSRGSCSMDDIRAMYGSEFAAKPEQQPAQAIA